MGHELSPGVPGDARGLLVRLVSRLLVALAPLLTAAALIHPAAARAYGPSPAAGALREPAPGDGELGQA